jgi:hypothetical protein
MKPLAVFVSDENRSWFQNDKNIRRCVAVGSASDKLKWIQRHEIAVPCSPDQKEPSLYFIKKSVAKNDSLHFLCRYTNFGMLP